MKMIKLIMIHLIGISMFEQPFNQTQSKLVECNVVKKDFCEGLKVFFKAPFLTLNMYLFLHY